MADTSYRKQGSREDPRLARREKPSSDHMSLYDNLDLSPRNKPASPSSRKDPRIRENRNSGSWQQENYNPSMQTTYQHLGMYGDYSSQAYQNSYNTGYQQGYAAQNNYYQTYPQQTYMPGTVQPGPPGEEYPQGGWAPVAGYNTHVQPSAPVASNQATSHDNSKSDEKKDAVAQELKQQKAQLVKQREDYVKKIRVLRRELELLRNQKQELLSENSPQRDTQHILRENSNLQDEIQSKLKAIYNVVEMLSNIIRDGKSVSDLEDQLRERSPDRRRKSISIERIDVSKKYNYVHYDPELHWCRTCDVFPKTAKDLLLHLQSEDHKKIAQERDMKDDTPWHHLPGEPELPYYEGAPKKRLPIKGLQFFIPAPAWYCKLCDTWIGDLHCASQHLKSQTHSQNYSNFVEQNPHWEIEWLKDRERALARTASKKLSESDDNEEAKKKKHKSSEVAFKEKKKKKRSKKRKHHSSDSSSSSSSSSDSSSGEENTDKSRSIRVAMRNMKVQAIMNEDLGSKWEMLGRLMDEHKKKEESLQQPKQSPKEDRLINQWNVVSEPQDKDKKLLDSLKDRMKQKHEAEKAKYEEMERKQKERERLEREQQEQKEREEKAAKEREEELKRMKERQELERIRDRDREQVKFRTKEKPRSPPPPRHYRDSRDTRDSRSSSTERHRERRRENGRSSNDRRRSRSRSRSPGDRSKRERKPPPPPSINKRLPFIGRMPLFKNKKPEEKVEKEIKKEDYDIPRQTRFEPGHLLRAFIPEPEVVCFPKLSSIPPITIPPPAPPQISTPKAPPPPKIGEDQKEKERKAKEEKEKKEMEEKKKKAEEEKQKANEFNASNYQMEQNMMAQYQYDYSMMYQQQMYDYSQNLDDELVPEDPSLIPPLEPPPLPPDDPNEDLAMLGLSADDMAVQSF